MTSVKLRFLDNRGIEVNLSKIKSALTEGDILKAERYRRESDRLLSYGGAYLIRKAARGAEVTVSETGKPVCEGIYFNISHSVDLVGIAETGSGPVGMDIEKIRDGFEAVRKKFTAEENESGLDFQTLYTSKESLSKAEGSGLRAGVENIPALPVEGQVIYRGEVYYRHAFPMEGYRVSVCLKGEDFEIMVSDALGE